MATARFVRRMIPAGPRRAAWNCLPVLAVLALAAPAAAQGVFITDEALAQPNTGDTRYAMSVAEPTADPSFKDYVATGFGALTYTTAFEYTVEQPFVAAGELTWRAYISCDQPTPFRPGYQNSANDVPTIRAELLRGSTVLATAPKYETRTCDGPSDIWEAVFPFDATGQEWAAGNLLRVNLIVWTASGPASSQAHNVYVLGGAAHPSGLTGPGLPGGPVADGPVTVQQNVTDGFRHTFETAHDDRYILTFPVGDGVNITLRADVVEGNASVVLRDAVGQEVYNATWTASGGFHENLTGTPGNWTWDIQYHGFVGTLEGNMTPLPPPDHGGGSPGNGSAGPGDGGTGTDDGGTGTDDGNGTAGPKGTPLPAWLVVGALAAAGRRRR